MHDKHKSTALKPICCFSNQCGCTCRHQSMVLLQQPKHDEGTAAAAADRQLPWRQHHLGDVRSRRSHRSRLGSCQPWRHMCQTMKWDTCVEIGNMLQCTCIKHKEVFLSCGYVPPTNRLKLAKYVTPPHTGGYVSLEAYKHPCQPNTTTKANAQHKHTSDGNSLVNRCSDAKQTQRNTQPRQVAAATRRNGIVQVFVHSPHSMMI